MTGFECSPSYINQVKPGEFPRALRNLHLITIVTEAPLMLLVLALVPMDAVLGGSNVLALLGQVAGRGAFLKLFVVVDACIVLCGGIITGIVAHSAGCSMRSATTGWCRACCTRGCLGREQGTSRSRCFSC